MENELKKLVGKDEKILYEGKPDKRCFVMESIFNPLLIIALIWAIFDFNMMRGVNSMMRTTREISSMATTRGMNFMGSIGSVIGGMGLFFTGFLILHLLPVWIYLASVIFLSRRYANTYYIVTDRSIYVSGGVFRKSFETKSFFELSQIDLHRGYFDQIFGVGDIVATSNQFKGVNVPATITLRNISNYMELYELVKKLQQDIYTDVMYPNTKRPKENPGYKTKYTG